MNLQAYKLDFPCDVDPERYSSFLLLINNVLDSDISHAKVILDLGDNSVDASICPCGPVDLNREQVKFLKFSDLIYSILSALFPFEL